MWGTKSMKRIIALSASLGFGLMFNSVVTAAVPTLEIVGASGNTSTTGLVPLHKLIRIYLMLITRRQILLVKIISRRRTLLTL